MNTIDIAVDLIDDTRMDPKFRTLKPELADSLALDLEMQGLTHAITVRPDPEDLTRFILVAGQHRLRAAKALGWEKIECKVKEGINEEQALMTSITENFLRGQLNHAQQGRSVKRYEAYFMKWMAANKPETSIAERKKEFRKRLIESTKKSSDSIERIKKVADAFTEEELEILEHLGIPQEKLLELATIEENARGHAVSLLAMGVDIEEVLKQNVVSEVIPEPEVLKELKKETKAKDPEVLTVSPVSTPEEEQEAFEEDESDEEWLKTNCSYLSQHLQNPANFNGDAVFYRNSRNARQAFREDSKKDLEKAKKGCHGPFYKLMEKLVNLSHPKDWHLCGDCQGNGCRSCGGGGYWITSEEYK
jgi:hypothetical protein